MKTEQTSLSLSYMSLVYLFAALLLIVIIGFFKTYFVFFPGFDQFRFAHHFHAFFMVLWLLVLIVQPLLISKGLNRMHKAVGKSSYFIASLTALSIFMVSRQAFYHPPVPNLPEIVRYAMQALSLPNLFAFVAFYLLAISNTSNTPAHMRYMMGTAILMLGPGLGRILTNYAGIPFPGAVIPIKLIELGLVAALLIYDARKKNPTGPAKIITTVIVMTTILWVFRFTPLWQPFARIFADIFY